MSNLNAITTAGTEIVLEEAAIEALKGGLRGELLRDGDPGYDEARVIWNGMIDKKPALMARCRGTADVIDAVNFACERDLLLSVRGGGHNVAGNAICDRGMMIDLSLMCAVRVDPNNRRAWVQGGATWGDVDHPSVWTRHPGRADLRHRRCGTDARRWHRLDERQARVVHRQCALG